MSEIQTKFTRRSFILGVSAVATGAVILTVPSINAVTKLFENEKDETLTFTPNLWLTIDPDGTITVTNSRGEMGQGTRTTMAMIVAEELDADWNKIKAVQAVGDSKYGNQSTGGSQSVMTMYTTLRNAGATARAMLITAAAQTWGISEANCRADTSFVFETNGTRKLSYGELADKASTLPVPSQSSIKLKDPKNFKIIGTPKMHIDNPDIITGKAIFGIDVKIPNMKYAVLAIPPTIGGGVNSYDDTDALKIKGVIKTLRISNYIAVIADNTWAAMKGVEALKVNWRNGNNTQYSSADISKSFNDNIGTLPNMPGSSVKVIESRYEVPYMAHSTMEPMNCVADYRGTSMEVWSSTQSPQSVRSSAAQGAGLNEVNVKANMMLTGGGFGRRLGGDYAQIAAAISKAAGIPIKFMYTKTNCLQNDYYRTASLHAMKAGIDGTGKITGWVHKAFGSGGAGTPPYTIPSPQNLTGNGLSFVPTGAWRSVGNTQIVFANECFIDEVAIAAGADPLEWRLANFGSNSKLKTVLLTLKEKSEWTKPLPKGWGRGVALFSGYGANIGHVVEVSIDTPGKLTVERIVSVCDNNLVINPLNVQSQIMGAAIDGLSTAIKAEITIKNGAIEQTNWHDFEWCRIEESPRMEIHLVPSGGSPSGMGEVGFPSVTPALCNAIFNACGKRIYKLPISKYDLSTSVEEEKKNEGELKVFPNPINDDVRINIKTAKPFDGIISFEISDIKGSRILHLDKYIESNIIIEEVLSLSDFSSGVYLLRVSFGGKVLTSELIKK